MSETYVFDFYNLYIPKGMKYENKELNIKIAPLKIAEDFEKNRKKSSSKYHYDNWKTAKCFIKAKTQSDAEKIAIWLDFLYSFAQGRNIFFFGCYKYKKGKKYSSHQSKILEHRKNESSELIKGTYTSSGYTRDISFFMDIALGKLDNSRDKEIGNIIKSLHAYLMSDSRIAVELKFLTCWVTLEALSNTHYSVYKSKNKLFHRKEIKKIKKHLESSLKKILPSGDKFYFLNKNISKNFLYEHDSNTKLMLYFSHIDIGFDKTKLNKMIKKLSKTRNVLTHSLHSNVLIKECELLFYLQKIMQNVIFRILGIDKNMQKQLMLNQYNRGNDL